MICFTTRNRPKVLEYSLKKTREVYDGFIQIIDDASDTHEPNRFLAKKYDCAYLLNNCRWGIPRSKDRGFRALMDYGYQYWFDDDCFPKEGWLERVQEAQESHPHLLHLKTWTHIRAIRDLGIVQEFSGATACFMAFTMDQYDQIDGFYRGHDMYGGWHHNLSLKLMGGYYALKDSSKYIHSFDIDRPPADFDSHFCSSLPREERVKK